MVSRRESADESAQVHILEMITLFWLFFMTATFILQLKVPDPTSPASDGICLLYTSPSPRDGLLSRMPSSA